MMQTGTLNIQFKSIIGRLRESSFVKNVLIVMTGTAAAQAVGFAMSPIISRLFTPADFGVFGSFNAVLMIIAAGATLDYSQAIMLPKEKEDAINLFTLSCISTIVITGIFLVTCLMAPIFFQNLIHAPSVWFLALLILAILVTGLNRSFQAWSVRVKAFKHTSASQVIRSLSSNGTQVGLGFFKMGAAGLVCAAILGEILASVNLFRVLLPDLLTLRSFITWQRIKELSKKYRDFPLYSASREVINSLSRGLPVLLLTYFYGIAVAGAYAFGVRIMNVPMNFVLGALRQVLFQKASESYNYGGRLMLLYLKTTGGLFAMALFPSLVLFIWSPKIFTFIFGSQWHVAGEFARWLVLWLMVMFCNLPSTLFARIIRIQREAFIFDLIVITARASALIVGGIYLSALQTVILFSVIGGVLNITWIILVGYALMKKEYTADWRGILKTQYLKGKNNQ